MATPAPSDVRAGVNYVDSDAVARVGTLVVPDEDEVLGGVAYGAGGAEFLGAVVAIDESPTTPTQNGTIKSPIFKGTDYLVSIGKGFIFRVLAPVGVDPEDAIVHFRARKPCSDSYAWDSEAESVTLVTVGGVAYWDCKFDLLATQTADSTEGVYYWWVVAETTAADVVLKHYKNSPPLQLLKA